MTKIYPTLPQLLYHKQKNQFDTKQTEQLFIPMSQAKNQLLNLISSREDYTYYHGKHILTNSLTCEKIVLVMNEYDIEVEENDENHVIFDMLKLFSHNFYMICS